MSELASNRDAERILRDLNDRQKEAVRCTSGPLLVIAGPGSGKTRVLTARVAYLIAVRAAWPSQILALTFTNKAAREMQRRVLALLPRGAGQGIAMGTFHSVMARLLRRELRDGWLPGYTNRFAIYDKDDSLRVIRQLMDEHNIDKKSINPNSVAAIISRAKNAMIAPGQFEQNARTPIEKQVAKLYHPYLETLHRADAMDFDDLLLKPLELFRSCPPVLEKYQQRWRHVHIDEYQDTNRVQYLLSHAISQDHRNICVVGDDAQSIYSFRGADMRNILDFNKDYPDAKVVRLEQNYRSTQTIVRLADSIIKGNTNQLKKNLWTQNDPGDRVVLIDALNGVMEANKATDCIRSHRQRNAYAYKDFAILYRTNAQSRPFEDSLRAKGVPYRVVGGTSFYQRKEVKDALAYLRLMVNTDDQVNLFRIINYPTRAIGLKTQEKLRSYARFNGISAWEALEQCGSMPVGTRASNALKRFRDLITRHRAQLSSSPPDEVARRLLTRANLFMDLNKDSTDRGVMRVQNVQEVISAIKEHMDKDAEHTLSTYLQSIALLTDADEGQDDDDRVTLMTLHASKGLEFKVVFIGGLEEGLFPTYRAIHSPGPNAIEEERRLFYVGVTRAERHLYLACARSRLRFGRVEDCVPSQFLEEIDTSVTRPEGTSPYERRPKAGRSARGYRPQPYGLSSHGDTFTNRPAPHREATGGMPAARIKDIKPGARVLSETFGTGRVVSTSGRGLQKTATVQFDTRGHKKLMLRYARLRLLR